MKDEEMGVPAVSVIVPIFKTEPWLRRCLDSIVGQTMRNIEIICVNDASPGDAAEILYEYMVNDSRISLINHTENRGVAAARNSGISMSCGLYIGFVDSDDTIDFDFYEKLYRNACETDADIVQAPISIPNGSKRIQYIKYTWFYSSIFKSDFIKNKIEFPSEIRYGEDCVFMCDVMLASKKISKITNTFYNYWQIQGSASHNYTRKTFNDFLRAHNMIFEKIRIAIDSFAICNAFACRIIDYFFGHLSRVFQFRLGDSGHIFLHEAAANAIRFFHKFDSYPEVSANILTDEPYLLNILRISDIDMTIEYFLTARKALASELRSRHAGNLKICAGVE